MMIADLIERARATPIEAVAERHGIKLRGKIDRCGPCPRCSGVDRFSVNVRKQVFFCRGCGAKGDSIALEMHITGSTFNGAAQSLSGGLWPASRETRAIPAVIRADAAQPQPWDEGDNGDAALRLWLACVDPRSTLVETYLRLRGLELGDDIAGVLRWNPSVGAMLALFRDIGTDEPHAVSRTFLDSQGRKLERKFLGPVGGCAVKLDADDSVLGGLHIAEGIETAMAARQLGLRPTWALGSAGAVAAFPVLDGVECLTLLAEHDDASARAVEACAARWHAAGREVLINRPIGGKDLNDAVRGCA